MQVEDEKKVSKDPHLSIIYIIRIPCGSWLTFPPSSSTPFHTSLRRVGLPEDLSPSYPGEGSKRARIREVACQRFQTLLTLGRGVRKLGTGVISGEDFQTLLTLGREVRKLGTGVIRGEDSKPFDSLQDFQLDYSKQNEYNIKFKLTMRTSRVRCFFLFFFFFFTDHIQTVEK